MKVPDKTLRTLLEKKVVFCSRVKLNSFRITKSIRETDLKLIQPQLVHNLNHARHLLTDSRLWILLQPKLSGYPIMNRSIIKGYFRPHIFVTKCVISVSLMKLV